MTLASVDDHVPHLSPVRTRVCVVVVGQGTADGMGAVLDTVAAQGAAPDRVLVVGDPGLSDEAVTSALGDIEVHVLRGGPTAPRAAVHHAVNALEGDWLVWVLTSGCTAGADTLAGLLEAHRRSPSVGVVAPKLVDATDHARLRSVGIRATRAGRIVDDPADGAPDQGQFDDRHDVLAVPLVGSLVESSLIRELGGWEPTFGDVGGDLDFGWRAQRRGRRVLVLPRVAVRVDAGVGLATATTPARRRAGRRVALARASWWGAPLLALWVLVSSIVGAIALALAKRPRAAAAALGDVLALDPWRVPLAWWRTRGGATVRRADLTGLFVSGAEFRRRIADDVHEALVPSVGRDEESAGSRRSTAMRVLSHPGLLVTLVVAALYAAAGRRLGTGLLLGLGGGPTGGELIGGPISASALWHSWTDGWRGAGLGTEAPGGPHLGLLAASTWLVEHLPGLGAVASPGGLVVGVLLLLGPLLATASAYVAARVLTRAPWPRAAAALVWAVAGPAAQVYAEGRVGAVVAHVLLPAVGAGLVLLARADGTATAAWATALGAGVLGAFAPATLVLTAALSVLVLLAAPTTGARVRALVPLLVTPLLLGPWLLTVRDDPRQLLGGPGLASWGQPEPSLVDLWTGLPAGPGPLRGWTLVPVALLAALAVIGLLTGPRLRSLSSGLAVAGVLALAGVFAAPRIQLGVDAGADAGVTPWVGLPMLAFELVVIALALRACAAPSALWAGRAATVRSATVALLALAGVLAAATLVLQTVGDQLAPWRDPRPAVAVDHATGDLAGRTLFITAGPTAGSEATFTVLGREVGDVARGLPSAASANAPLERAVSDLVSGLPDATTGLQRYAVGVVALDGAADPALERALDAADGLTRLVARDGWNFWRVAAAGVEGERPVAPARLELRSDERGMTVPATGQHAATDEEVSVAAGERLVVAEPEAWTEHAVVTWQGQVLAPVTGEDRPSYALAPGEGELSVVVTDPHAPLRRAQLVLAAVVLFLAIPFGSRASRRHP